MRLFVLFVIVLLGQGSPANAQETFGETELISATRVWLDRIWDFGQKARETHQEIATSELTTAINDLMLGPSVLASETKKTTEERRDTLTAFAEGLAKISKEYPPYRMKPFVLGLRLAKSGEAPVTENSVVWIVRVNTPGTTSNAIKWIFHLVDAASAEPNLIGQRVLKLLAVSKVLLILPDNIDNAPADNGWGGFL
ncbi:hypothetical protein A3A71_03220 [Candidatus Berkelbacteria bacterium RIFCSPLOWO2_01_FULL_50_28]|uniref:Uncharacterized protein n=1 Tax=Candidatus Berkelbacteria bacterium RIFCSPLOWO2_01_FULL_50_28 TaxID=1797471 RepID=A0A1F5ECJ0_9BACT|nr:MAG: hypothetical protein A2807_02785 [Candidatus Berkelbacteria bacterium RIFCSPHIGHO2_01_FULL_50_36]OGD65073.1 MAG: hypothetical protein A3A71_03220 [Candidatus Berkelbacteria bacterium RIFCSPLOWO2_01_FULL_50_28]